MSNSSTSTHSLLHQQRVKLLADKCDDKSFHSSNLQYSIRRIDMLDYLGFVLRSHSLFYCSVPKVATRTFLTFITYLHIRDDLTAWYTTNLTNEQHNARIAKDSALFNAGYLSQMLSLSTTNVSQLSIADRLSILASFQSRLSNASNISSWDLWKIYQDKVFPLIRLQSLSDSNLLLSDTFTRVIFVRHPLERLASAYIDKITALQNSSFSLYDDIRRMICRKFASFYLKPNETAFYHSNRMKSKMTDEPCEKVVPSFQHFLEYITSDSVIIDVHWQPYSSLCRVCTFKYNFIGKYETIQDDLNILMSRINLTSIGWNFDRRFSTGRTRKQYQSMYNNLPDQLMCRLKNIYHNDFKLFDYRLEDYLSENRTFSCSYSFQQRSLR